MGSIFISYRREDSKREAQHFRDKLAAFLPASRIVFDIDSIPPGANWRKHIEESVASCDVLIAVIGEQWLTVKSKDGSRRLDQPDDWVRVEIETALKRGIQVIPLLLDATNLPTADQLPTGLNALMDRQCCRVDCWGVDFGSQVQRLALKIVENEQEAEAARRRPPGPNDVRVLRPNRWAHCSDICGVNWKWSPRPGMAAKRFEFELYREDGQKRFTLTKVIDLSDDARQGAILWRGVWRFLWKLPPTVPAGHGWRVRVRAIDNQDGIAEGISEHFVIVRSLTLVVRLYATIAICATLAALLSVAPAPYDGLWSYPFIGGAALSLQVLFGTLNLLCRYVSTVSLVGGIAVGIFRGRAAESAFQFLSSFLADLMIASIVGIALTALVLVTLEGPLSPPDKK